MKKKKKLCNLSCHRGQTCGKQQATRREASFRERFKKAQVLRKACLEKK